MIKSISISDQKPNSTAMWSCAPASANITLPMRGFEKLLEGSRPLPRRLAKPAAESGIELMQAAAESGALDFWLHPDEDVYTLDDGEPV
jgi:hypothetical protein